MNIGILTFSSPKNDQYSGFAKLVDTGEKLGHAMTAIHTPFLSFQKIDNGFQFKHEGEPLPDLDVILTRPNFTAEPGIHTPIVDALEQSGIKIINRSAGITFSKNKLTQHVHFSKAGLPLPQFGIAKSTDNALFVAKSIGFPVIIKVAFGTHGVGVFYADNAETLLPISDYLGVRDGNAFIIEKFIAEADRKDVRAFVTGNEIVAAMERKAKNGDVRANIAQNGSGHPTILSDEEIKMVKKAVQVSDLEVAGVDLLRTKNGPLLLEINANPGFKELEEVTGVPVTEKIIRYLAG